MNYKNIKSKMKRLTAISLSLVISGTLAFSNIDTALAAVTSDGRLYSDGNEIVYDFYNPKPLFIDGNAYLPIRATADYLNMNFQYNPNTLTMTFSKAGVNTSYTLNQNELFVNGQEIYFSKPAIIVNDTTYMSVEMFATAINAEVVQDFNTRSIHVYSNPSTTVVTSSSKPLIMSVTAERYNQEYRETISISVMTTVATKSVRLIDYNGQVVAQSTDYVTTGNNRKFVLKYSPDINFSSEQLYYIHPGDGTNYYSENGKNIKFNETIFLNSGYEILSVNADDRYLDNGDSTYVYVYTTDDVERVKLTNNRNSTSLTSTDYYTTSAGTRYFRFLITKNNDLDVIYTATGGSLTSYGSESMTLTIYDENSTNYNTQTNVYGDIYEIDTDYGTVPVGNYFEVAITTDDDIEAIEIKDSSYETIATLYEASATRYNNYLVWTKNIKIDNYGEQRYYVYAYPTEGDFSDFDRGSFTVYGGDSYVDNNTTTTNGNGKIYDAYATDSAVTVGGDTDIYVETNRNIDYIEIRDDKNRVIENIYFTRQFPTSSTTLWKTTIPVEYYGTNDFTVYVYDYLGYYKTSVVRVYGE